MNEGMEAELTKTDSRPNNLAVSEDASVDESVPIYIRKECNTKSYKDTMRKNIKNIDTYETRTKVHTTKWIPIYEVIDEAYIEESKTFPGDFIRDCKNNSNEAQFISAEVKNNIKRIAIKQRILNLLLQIKRKFKLNLSFKVNRQDHNDGLILT